MWCIQTGKVAKLSKLKDVSIQTKATVYTYSGVENVAHTHWKSVLQTVSTHIKKTLLSNCLTDTSLPQRNENELWMTVKQGHQNNYYMFVEAF